MDWLTAPVDVKVVMIICLFSVPQQRYRSGLDMADLRPLH